MTTVPEDDIEVVLQALKRCRVHMTSELRAALIRLELCQMAAKKLAEEKVELAEKSLTDHP